MNFNNLYTLPRAGRYTNPLNNNDRLPLVYGDITDGSNGVWDLPCIDTVNHVYCFAASEVLSVVNGNSVSIYVDGVLENPANYTFNHSNDYESEGVIATVTFTADKGNSIITAKGMGKDDGAGTLMENIIDFIYDFLTVENDLTASDFDSTRKATAKSVFTGQSYKAAGVIDRDAVYWEILQKMMASFLGSVYLSSEKKVMLEIDDGTLPDVPTDILPKAKCVLIGATQRIESLVNQCPASYAYNYTDMEFRNYTSGSGYINEKSVNIYGARAPSEPYGLYWCRDLTSVQVMQDIITTKYGKPVWEIKFRDETTKRTHIDIGEILVVTIDELFDENEISFTNQFIKILSVKPDMDNNRVDFGGIDTGLYLLRYPLADGSVTMDGSVKAGSSRDLTEY